MAMPYLCRATARVPRRVTEISDMRPRHPLPNLSRPDLGLRGTDSVVFAIETLELRLIETEAQVQKIKDALEILKTMRGDGQHARQEPDNA